MPVSLFTGQSEDVATERGVTHAVKAELMRGSAIAESYGRVNATLAAQTLTTTQGYYTAVELAEGDVITNIVFTSVGASSSITNQFAGLYNSALGKIVVSADQTTTAWGANTERVFVLATPYTVPVGGAGLFYFLLGLTGSGLPTIAGVTGLPTLNARTPAVGFTDSTAVLGAPSTAPATATNSAGFGTLYSYAT